MGPTPRSPKAVTTEWVSQSKAITVPAFRCVRVPIRRARRWQRQPSARSTRLAGRCVVAIRAGRTKKVHASVVLVRVHDLPMRGGLGLAVLWTRCGSATVRRLRGGMAGRRVCDRRPRCLRDHDRWGVPRARLSSHRAARSRTPQHVGIRVGRWRAQISELGTCQAGCAGALRGSLSIVNRNEPITRRFTTVSKYREPTRRAEHFIAACAETFRMGL